MKKGKNSFWEFFASVKLALFCFFTLAFASIVGTIIPQKEQAGFYIQKYGESTAQFFQLLNIPDMYNSWWFVSLLSLFSINLIVCSIDRLPTVWKVATMDNLATTGASPSTLRGMGRPQPRASSTRYRRATRATSRTAPSWERSR